MKEQSPLFLNEEQVMLQDAVRAFWSSEAPVSHLRSLRDSGSSKGLSRELWQRTAELGLPMILVAPEAGGLGLGHVEAGIVQEEIGRNLTPSPFLSTAIGAAVALTAASGLREQWLPRIAAAEAIVAIACDEGAKHDPATIALTAERAGDGFVLNGEKRFVPHAHIADLWLVTARCDGVIRLFAVASDTAGIALETIRLTDAGIVSHLRFTQAKVVDTALVAGPDTSLDDMLDALRVGAAGELVGLAAAAQERTLAYLRDRRQFGAAIGSFQALQHRMAILHGEIALARGAVRKAQQALDAQAADRSRWASVAKAAASLAASLAAHEGLQMHGGIGMTDEHDIGLFLKRARVLTELYGDANFHAERLAKLAGY